MERYLDGRKPVSVAEQPAAVSLSPLAEDDIVVELARTLYCMGHGNGKGTCMNISPSPGRQ